MWTIPGLLGLVLMLLASAEASSSLQQYFTSDTALRPEVNNTEQLLADVENRARPKENSIAKLPIYKNHLVRVLNIGLTWKLEFDITVFRMPAFDKELLNVFHITENGNGAKDNILKLCVYRKGLHGEFSFNYWQKTKTMLFALGSTYHIVIEQYKGRRGKRYQYVITVDDDDLVNEVLKEMPKAHNHVKLYSSNPWEKTMTPKIGAVKNFVLTMENSTQCCKNIIIDIDASYLTSKHAKWQKSLIGQYSYKGTKNGRGYWTKKDGTAAIWYHDEYKEWMVGNINYLGTKWRGLTTAMTSVMCPSHNTRRWYYFDGTEWKADLLSHIRIHCQENLSILVSVNCQWSSWGHWSECSKSCGNGDKFRLRTKSTTAKFGGKECVGSAKARTSCNQRKCPENCKWSSWGRWSSCSKYCGNGVSQRKRTIVKYEKYGGRKCSGGKQEKRSCIIRKCHHFHRCVKEWCYQKGTKQQYTKCKSVSKDGNTCYLPEIRYGSTVGGRPAKRSRYSNILQWCKQLFPTSTRGTATYSSSKKLNIGKGSLFWCNGYDESGYHWCDNNDGRWKDSSLDYSLSYCNKESLTYCRMTSVTCQAK